MKLKKYLISILLLIVGCFATVVNAASTYNISASNIKMLYGSTYLGNGSTLNLSYKVNDNGQVVYCTEIHDTMTSTTETYTYSYEASQKIIYVLENGYPSKSITGNNDQDYYITALAIWYLIAPNDATFTYFNLSAGTYKGVSSTVVQEVNKLVSGAQSATTPSAPSLKLNSSSSTLTLSSDGKYYVSSAMSVSASSVSGNYSVSLSGAPTGTIVTNTSNTEQNSFATTESFIVKVPASSIKELTTNITVNVSANGTINKAYVYSPSYASHQSLVGLYPQNTNLNDSTSLNITNTTKVSISKLDIANDEELKGATLVVKDSNGNVVEQWISDGTTHVITGLALGTYTLTEITAPDGYTLNTETVGFTLTADKLETTAVMYNSKTPTPTITISKQDITNGKELPGATLVVKDSQGNIIEQWVSTDTPHEIEGLTPGEKYTLTEISSPDGYTLNTETIEFIVNEDGTSSTVIMYNAPAETITEVPKTSSYKTIAYSLIGLMIIGLGSIVIYRNFKENE